MKSIIQLGEFDTGLYAGCEFYHADGNGYITVHVDEYGNKTIEFKKIRFHRFTALPNCTSRQVSAYFELKEVERSEELAEYIKKDQSSAKAYSSLRHFIIFLDETGCFEVFAEEAKLLPNNPVKTARE
jgi:hypothetical protein